MYFCFSSGDWNSEDTENDDDSDKAQKRKRKCNHRKAAPQIRRQEKRSTARSSRYRSESEDEDETETDDSDSDSQYRKKGRRKASDSKPTSKVSLRNTNTKQISYKETSDHTDSDDLIPVEYANGDAAEEEEKEEGDVVEKVLEQRFGKVGATGLSTTHFNVQDNGDPNLTLETDEKELQFQIKWKGLSYIHCTWESRQTLESYNAKGLKKIENYLKKEDEIRTWYVFVFIFFLMFFLHDIFFAGKNIMLLQKILIFMNVKKSSTHNFYLYILSLKELFLMFHLKLKAAKHRSNISANGTVLHTVMLLGSKKL